VPTADADFERLLASALSEPMTPAQRAALDGRLARTIAAAPAPGSTRSGSRGRSRRLILLLALLAIAIPVAAVGVDDLSAFIDRWATGPEFQTEIDVAKAEVPLPEGRDWPDVASLDPANWEGGAAPFGVEHQTYETGPGAALSIVESVAACVWFDEWLLAHDAGDEARAAAAADGIAQIPTWRSWDSEWWDSSYTDLLQQVIDGVAAGDPEQVRGFTDLNCDFAS
jgi:hypothetical protein